MSNHIDFITFKKLLNNKNILLFDGQYRIIHFRFNNLLANIQQIGGSNLINPYDNKLNYLTDKLINNYLFDKLINSLLENNNQTTNYIINLII
jgi:hypothetical protein